MSAATVTQGTASSTTSTAGNPGKVGEMPTAPGTAYFPEAAGYRNFAKMLYWTAAFWVVLGVVMQITIGGPSWLMMLPAPAFVFWAMNRQKRQLHVDCVADARGLTVRTMKGSTPQPPVFLAWEQIQQTHCSTFGSTFVDDSGGETKKDYLTFRVVVPGSSAQIEETRVKNLAGIIALTNQNTPQLEYVWLPAAQAKDRRVLAKTSKYWMVAR